MLKIDAKVEFNGVKYNATFSLDPETIVTPDPNPTTTTNTFFGVNTFPWVPVEKLKPFGSARIYCSSNWIWQPDGLFVQPMFQAETAVAHGIDDVLKNMKANNISPLLCIHQTPEWLFKTGDATGANDYPPVNTNMARNTPISYSQYVKMLYQVAARYGDTVVDTKNLSVSKKARWTGDIPQQVLTGQKLLKFIEPWNEPDKWWKKVDGKFTEYFTPEETAAFMSACYDGHEGLIPFGGIKTADPSMKVVMPGLTGCEWNYINSMDIWFKANRKDKKWPCDIFNLHYYNNNGNIAGKYPPTWTNSGAIAITQDKSLIDLTKIVQFVKTLNIPLWVTEFGCDSKEPSQMAVVGGEKSQGEIIKSDFVYYKQNSVDRAFVFNISDEPNAANGGLWQSSGLLTTQASGYNPKDSFNIVSQYINSIK